MGFTTDVEVGFALLIAGSGAAVWHPDGSAYLPTDTAITLKRLMAAPARQACLTFYPVQASGSDDTILGAVQVRTRGNANDTTDVDTLGDAIYVVLHRLLNVVSNGITFALIWHQSGAPLGEDNNGQSQRSDNYYFRAARPTNALSD